MRLFCTLGRVGLTDHWDMILSPAQPYEDHRRLIKDAKVSPVHPRYSEVQLWSSGGGCESRVKLTGYVENPDPETMAALPIVPGVVNVPPPPEPDPVPPETPVVPEEAAVADPAPVPPDETAETPPEAGFALPPAPPEQPTAGRRRRS